MSGRAEEQCAADGSADRTTAVRPLLSVTTTGQTSWGDGPTSNRLRDGGWVRLDCDLQQ
jgi:hypothetical protein